MTPARLPQTITFKIPLKIVVPIAIALLGILLLQIYLYLTIEEPEIPKGLQELCEHECLNASYTHGKVVVNDYNDTSMELSCNCYNNYNELLWEVTDEVEIKY